jgi:hypothetical protein
MDRYTSAAGLPPEKHTCRGMKPPIATHRLDGGRMLACVEDLLAAVNILLHHDGDAECGGSQMTRE